jgi:hypothetical protein
MTDTFENKLSDAFKYVLNPKDAFKSKGLFGKTSRDIPQNVWPPGYPYVGSTHFK